MYLKNALRGTAVVFTLSLLTGLFGYLTRIILARRLTVAEFGLFYSVITVFFFINYFLDSGMSQAMSRNIVEMNIKKKIPLINNLLFSVLYIQIISGFIFSIILIFSANFLSKNYFHADASATIVILCVWLISSIIISVYNSIFTGFQKFHLFAIFDTLKSFLILLSIIILFFFNNSQTIPAISYALANIVILFLAYFFVKRIYPKFSFTKFQFDKKTSLEAFKFGIFIALSNWIWFLITQTDTLVLTYFTDSVHVALYQVAVPISALLLYLTNALAFVLFPVITELKTRKDTGQIVNGLQSIYKYLIMLLLPVVIIIFAFPDIIINILFTSKYLGAVTALRILSVASIFLSIAIINNSVLTALGQPKKVAKTMFIIAILNLVMNLVLIPKYGIIGAASSTIISFFIAAIISSIYIRKEIKIKYPLAKWAFLTVWSLVLIYLVNILRNIINLATWPKLILISIIVIIIYLSLNILFRIIDLNELKDIIALALRKSDKTIDMRIKDDKKKLRKNKKRK